MATDPNNAEVLLSLGVSYTNELDQGRALNFLTAWLSRQPAFTKVCLYIPVAGHLSMCMGSVEVDSLHSVTAFALANSKANWP